MPIAKWKLAQVKLAFIFQTGMILCFLADIANASVSILSIFITACVKQDCEALTYLLTFTLNLQHLVECMFSC